MRDFQFPGRSNVHATQGMAATSHPLATFVAVDTLRSGGSAIDAAIAASATLCVVEPHMTGIGGDCFVLYSPADRSDAVAYNGSGRAPERARAEWYREQGFDQIGAQSAHSVTVPGAVEAWARLSADFGRKPWHELFAAAIGYAADGYPIHARVAHDWSEQSDKLSVDPTTASQMLINGGAPTEGTIHRQPLLSETLRTIASEGAAGFYRGPVAADIVNYLQGLGGLHTLEDFAAHAGEYVAPISTTYRDHEVFECPPNGQGLTALLMLNLLSNLPTGDDPLHPQRLHYLAEASRIAYRERDARIADPAFAEVPVDEILGSAYTDRLLGEVAHDRAGPMSGVSDFPQHRDTVYLAVVDGEGNCASFINSIFEPFGSGLMAPESGVLLHNRGKSFHVDPQHPNGIEPRKRPMHTIIPAMLKRHDKAVAPFGVMGAHFQPTGQTWLLGNILDYGLDIQEAIDLPRAFRHDGAMQLEQGIPESAGDALKGMGHEVSRVEAPHGGAQMIWRNPHTGLLSAGSDPRKDGCALGF